MGRKAGVVKKWCGWRRIEVREDWRDFRRGWWVVALSTTALGGRFVNGCWVGMDVDGLDNSLVDCSHNWGDGYCGG
jgi:hypothetical protein